jgi:hypothetical protein
MQRVLKAFAVGLALLMSVGPIVAAETKNR